MPVRSNPVRRLLPEHQGAPARAIFNLVVPLANPATAMRTRDTTGTPARSRAVAPLSNRPRDVDSTTRRSTRPTTPGTRTLPTATRTTGTRTTSFEPASSADRTEVVGCAGFSLEAVA
jgi:RNA-directed DNA polymerase